MSIAVWLAKYTSASAENMQGLCAKMITNNCSMKSF